MTREALAEFMTQYGLAEDISMIPQYADLVHDRLRKLSATGVNLTVEYDNTELQEGSVAFHLIKGSIMYGDDPFGFFFSTKRLRDNIIAAENNPQIGGHLFLINSGGGDAYYLDVAAQTMREIEKPKKGVIERMAGSAALYLGVNSGDLYTQTQNEIIGSIGTMVSGLDIIPYFEKLGAKYIEEYSHLSDRKNAKTNGLLKDIEEEKEKFITDELDPLAEQFRSAVKQARPATAELSGEGKKEHPLFRGETYSSNEAAELGLIDGIQLIEDVVQEIAQAAANYMDKQNSVDQALRLIS
ncbi:MAG: S49 family peptidase [Bacteroidota bacterium]